MGITNALYVGKNIVPGATVFLQIDGAEPMQYQRFMLSFIIPDNSGYFHSIACVTYHVGGYMHIDSYEFDFDGVSLWCSGFGLLSCNLGSFVWSNPNPNNLPIPLYVRRCIIVLP